jgi:hypothetical protein
VELPLLARIAICVSIATSGLVTVRRVFLLKGPTGVRALSWSGIVPGLQVHLGGRATPLRAELGGGSFRLGSSYLLLWLRTSEGSHAVFIDANRQAAGCFRRLCGRLQWPPRVP